jgi:beta-galactosidase
MVDRKGITSSVAVTAEDGSQTDIHGWTTHLLPLTEAWFRKLKTRISDPSRPGQVFRAEFEVDTLGDTYLDMSKWTKGLVFVNGHNLGRYWNVGPQLALFCPAGFLRRGTNTIHVLDLHRTEQAPIAFVEALDDVDLPGRGGTVYAIAHLASGKVLGIAGGSQSPGAKTNIETGTGESSQQWEVVDLGSGYSTILNRHSGLALDNLDHKLTAGNPIGQWADGGGLNQQWELTRGGDASYTIRNRESGLYLTALATTEGAPVTQEELTGDSSRWTLTEA